MNEGDKMIEDAIMSIAAESFNVDKNKLRPESRIVEDIGADSIEIVWFTAGVEEKFNIDIPEQQGFRTLGDVINFVKEHAHD